MDIWTNYRDTNYQVAPDGKVRNKATGKALKPRRTNKGYLYVEIHGIKKAIHRLVAECYIPNIELKPQIDHIDCNKEKNNYKNLRWVTNSENQKHRWQVYRFNMGKG